MGVITNAQIELLELFKQDLTPSEMLELRRLLVSFKSQRVLNMLNEEWDSQGWTEEKMLQIAQEHNRTPYTTQNEFLSKQSK